MTDAWEDYSRWAWGQNELRPISQSGQNGGIFGNAEIGATIIDSLDTLYIMEMMDEYQRARNFAANLTFIGIVSEKAKIVLTGDENESIVNIINLLI